MGDHRLAGGAVAGDKIHHAGRQPGLGGRLGELSAGEHVVSAGLSTTVLPIASAGASFHASIKSGKFQGIVGSHAQRVGRWLGKAYSIGITRRKSI